ncbi:DUF86 domain-containing protein [bacterium]|nr:DUF86 domain-containing protein [bacterium]
MKKDIIRVKHILDSIEKIESLIQQGREVYYSDETVQDSIIRKLEIIGEAVKYLSPEFTNRYPEISWKEFAGMRDVLIHQYFGVDLEVVWRVANNRLPKLRVVLKHYLKETEVK